MAFDCVEVGASRVIGRHLFVQDAIVAFAENYDPQFFHVDPVAAKESIFGGLIAAGSHTATVFMRLASEFARGPEGTLLGLRGVTPGFEHLRWERPVRPQTTLLFRVTVVEKFRDSGTKGLGLVKHFNEAIEESGEVSMRFTGRMLVPL